MIAYIIILSLFLVISLYYNYKFAISLLKITDAIESCLDALDEKYYAISKILEIPVMYDSPQIRSVVKEIKESRDLILQVANEISSIEEDKDGEEESS